MKSTAGLVIFLLEASGLYGLIMSLGYVYWSVMFECKSARSTTLYYKIYVAKSTTSIHQNVERSWVALAANGIMSQINTVADDHESNWELAYPHGDTH